MALLRQLTPKQEKVGKLVAEGLTNKEIAVKIGTTENVIKNVLREVYNRTGMWTRLEFTLWYLKREAEQERLSSSSAEQFAHNEQVLGSAPRRASSIL